MVDGLFGANGFLAVGAVEHRNGKPPMALSGNAPVSPFADHLQHPLASPGGNPVHLFRRLAGILLEGVHRAEPLRSCSEDDGGFAPPAVGIGVYDVFRSKKRSAFDQIGKNGFVGFVIPLAGEFSGIFGLIALVIHRYDHINVVAAGGYIVVCAEASGGVYASGTAVHCDILGVDQKTCPV